MTFFNVVTGVTTPSETPTQLRDDSQYEQDQPSRTLPREAPSSLRVPPNNEIQQKHASKVRRNKTNNVPVKNPSCDAHDAKYLTNIASSEIVDIEDPMGPLIAQGASDSTAVFGAVHKQQDTVFFRTPPQTLTPNLLRGDLSVGHSPNRKSQFDQAIPHPKKRRVSIPTITADTVSGQMAINEKEPPEGKVDECRASTPSPTPGKLLSEERGTNCCYVGKWVPNSIEYAVFAKVHKRGEVKFKFKVLTSVDQPRGDLSIDEFVQDDQLGNLSECRLSHFARLRLPHIMKGETIAERQVNVECAIKEASQFVEPGGKKKSGGVRIATSASGGAVCVNFCGSRISFVIYDKSIWRTNSLIEIEMEMASFLPTSRKEVDIRSYVTANRYRQHRIDKYDHYEAFPTIMPRE